MIYSIAAVAVLFFILFKISVSSNKKKGGSFSGDLADAQLQKIRAADFTKSNVMKVTL
ncbi:hypothetical protein [Erwinia amylovora]|uniref:hypothetical protein n=1 Tax=Erwinia amylovora TaxID=552 RepID=UPI0020C08FAE|nr:hypothetical protein [Erwinia amylovora]MCK8417629.1 hypothetical protein [Erwinia amylovora]